MDYW
ncbi:hypothetical protein YPPY58_4931, partial [Yersinia pestis PY-58]